MNHNQEAIPAEAISDAQDAVTEAARKIMPVNAVFALTGAAACMVFATQMLTGLIIAGLAIGLLNQHYSLKVVRRCFVLDPDKAKRYVMVRYYLRFLVTIAAMAAVIALNIISPWGMLAGFSLILLTTAGALYFIAREGYA